MNSKEIQDIINFIKKTDLDDVSITTTSAGSSSVKKTGSGDISTLSISVAKSF